jgi:capsular polysaccharide biosynthesis protein
MLLRELAKPYTFKTFTARVKVRQPVYSQWIQVQISAKNKQEAQKLLLAQYGPGTQISGLVQQK